MLSSCSLCIAGIQVAFSCADSLLVGQLQERYRPFLAPVVPSTQRLPESSHTLQGSHANSRGPSSVLRPPSSVASPTLTAHIALTGSARSSSLLDRGTVFRDGVLRFTAAGYEGLIDETHGVAELCLSSAEPVEDVDYFLRVAYALLAFSAGGLLFHSAAVVRRGRAHLFFGHSGSGKTTVARLSAGDLVLNDDLVLLMPGSDGWVVHATPFWNPTQVRPTPESAPVAGLYRLVQDRAVSLEPMAEARALAELVGSVPVISAEPGRTAQLLERGQQLLRAVPVHRLHFLPDASFWNVIDHD